MTNSSSTLWNILDIFQNNFLRVMKEIFGIELKPDFAAMDSQAKEPKPNPRPRPSPGPPPNSPAKFADVVLKLEALKLPPNIGFHSPVAPSPAKDTPDTPQNRLSRYTSLDPAPQPKPKPRPRPAPRPPPNSPSSYTVSINIPEDLQVTKALTNPGPLLPPDAAPSYPRGYGLDELPELRDPHPVPRSVQGTPPNILFQCGVAVIRESEIPMDSRFRRTSCAKSPRKPPTNTSRYIYKPLSSMNSQGAFDIPEMNIACPIF